MARANDGQRAKPGEFRRGLMLYGSTAALAASLMLAEGGVGPAMAQSIGPRVTSSTSAQGDFTVPGPSPTPFFEQRSGTIDIINMRRDAVLNWTTYDNAPPGGANGNSYVNFLPAGTELRFVGNGQSFTAVNRIFTQADNAGAYRGIAFQGQVTSYLSGDGVNSVGPVAGNIWFFSPGGILATGAASFTVGSLLLSTSDLQNFTEGGNFRAVDFAGVADPFSAIILQTGARVRLTQPNSNFTIVAPTIEQGGDVFVDGSVHYLSAEQGSLTYFNDGSGFASVETEARAGNRIRHLGTTTGPASLATDNFTVFDPQTIEFRTGRDVAVLLSGTIGYAGATNAALGPNGSIVLSAGSVATQGDLTLTSNTSIEGARVELRAGAGETIAMGQDVNGAYGLSIDSANTTLAATGGGLIDIAGEVFVDSPNQRNVIAVEADGGRIEVGGDLTLDATVGRFQQGGQTGGSAEVTIAGGGSLDVGGTMRLDVTAFATEDANGITHAEGGTASIVIGGAQSSLTVGNELILVADGARPSGLCECPAPNSGSATGGYAGIVVNTGSVSASSLSVSASAEAFTRFRAAALGHSLEARGGTADIRLGDSFASVGSISGVANAQAASGAQGEAGGAATGGLVRFEKGTGGSLGLSDLELSANASGGNGGVAGETSFLAGRGGDAAGGTASITIGQNAPALGYIVLEAEATGGTGGSGSASGDLNGARGGGAQGGTASLTVAGADTRVTSVFEGDLSVTAEGGGGGDGASGFFSGEVGDGGRGGAAAGGSFTVTAADGAEVNLRLTPALAATGGTGGNGADGFFFNDDPVAPGLGGVGGDAKGARVAMVADGGIISGNLELDVQGIGGAGGEHGFDAFENPTGSAGFGEADGGAISLRALDNGASRFDIGFATLLASGNLAGTIEVLDQSTDPGASLRFGSFAAYASGNEAGASPTFRMSAANNAITVDQTTEINADSIALDFSGTGQLAGGGFTYLTSVLGDIAITHAANASVDSVVSTGPLDIYANGDYAAGSGTRVRGFEEVSIRTLGSIDAADTRGSTSVFIEAFGNATVGNVRAGGLFELYAGRYNGDGSIAYYPSARAVVTGAVTANSVLIESGGFAEFASGSSVSSDNAIRVRTGDDILVSEGASLISDIDPNQDFTLYLLAGDINVGPFSGDLVEPITTPIASLIVRGSLDTNGRDLYLSGDAVDATGSTITTGSLYVDVTDAPFIPPYSNDGGQLQFENCFQGRACLGSVTATGDVAIGLASNNGLISLAIDQLDFDGANFDVATLESISLGTAGIPGSLAASNRLSLISGIGDVVLASLTLGAPSLRIDAGSEILASSSVLQSPNAIRLNAGEGIALGTVTTGQRLDDGSGGPVFATDGYFTVNSLTYGNGNAIRIDAGGLISAGSLNAGSADIELVSGSSIFAGSTAAATGAIRLDGTSIGFDALDANGPVYLTARSGGITSAMLAGSGIDTAGDIALEAAQDIAVRELLAGGDIAADGTDVSITTLDAGGRIAVAASGTGAFASFASGGDATFTGTELALGSGTAGGNFAAQSSAGNMDFTSIRADGDGVLEAGAGIVGGDVAAGGNLTLDGGDVDVGTARSGGAMILLGDGSVRIGDADAATDLTAEAGTIEAGRAHAGGILVAMADGSVRMGTVEAGGNLTLEGGDIDGGTASSGGAMILLGDGSVRIDDADAATDLTIEAGTIEAGRAHAGGILVGMADGSVRMGTAEAGGNLTLNGGDVDVGTASSGGGTVTLAGASVALDAASFGTGLSLTARTTDLTGSGLYEGTGAASLTAARGIAIGSVDTLGGIAMDAGAEARFVELRSRDGSIAVNAGGAIAGSSVAATGSDPLGDDSVSLVAGGSITLDGATATLNPLSAAQDDFSARAGGAIAIVRAEAGRDLSLSAGTGAVSAANLAAGRDLALAGQSVELVAGTVARNLTASASAGDIAGSGVTTAGGAIALDASGAIAVGSLSATGGGIAATAGGSIGFADLGAAGTVALSAGSGIAGTGDIVAGGDVRLATAGGATSLRGINSTGVVALSGGGGLAMRDVLQNANGSLTVSYDGAIVLRDARFATGVDIAGGSSVAFGEIRSPGSIAIDAAGAISGTALDATNAVSASGTGLALGTVAVGEGDARLEATAGGLSASSVSAVNIEATATGELAVNGTSAGQSAALTGASLTLGTATAGTDLTLVSGAAGGITSGALSAGQALSVEAGSQGFTGTSLTAGSGLSVESAGDIGFASANAGGSAALDAAGAIAGGTITAGGFASAEAGGAIALSGLDAANAQLRSSGGAVSASGIAVDGLLEAEGTALALAAPGALEVEAHASAGGIGITAGGDLTVDARATGDIALASTGGSVIIGSVGQVDLEATGGIGVEAVDAGGAVSVSAANAISVTDSLIAGGALTMSAGGLVSLDGIARGQTISLQAGDLAIGTGGTLGGAGTQRIALASTNAINLGSGASGGFAVDTGEFARIQSGGDLMVAALAGTGTGAGSLTVGSLTVNAGTGGQIGGTGTFGLTASGLLDVNSTLAIARAGADNRLMLTGDAVDLDYANAQLSVLDTANAITGRVGVSGRVITSMSAAAAADIVGKTPAEISERLGLADVVRDIALFRTGTLTLEGRDAILIQNSGGAAADDRRGLAVGALTVTGAADGRTLVVINGIVANATGNTAAQNVTVTTALAGGSTVNGCILANIASCFVIPEPPPPLIEVPDAILIGTSDLIKDEEEDDEVEDGVADGQPEAPPIDTTKIDDPAGLPMIDDPVTGAGNEDLWQPPDE